MNFILKKKKNYSKIELIKKLHLAYYKTINKDLNKVKLLFIHTHTISYTKKLIKFAKLKNFSIIHTMRHPIIALYSPIKNWLNFNNGKSFFSRDLYFQYDLAVNGISDLLKLSKNLYIVQLENLINKKSLVMKDFCKIFKVKFINSMLECTFFGKQWWGDKISKKWLGKTIKKKKFKKIELDKFFYKRDLYFFQSLTRAIIEEYYEKEYYIDIKDSKNIILIPLKSELLVWKNTFKNFRVKHLLSIPYYFLKRLMFINQYFKKKIIYPYSLGSEK